MATIEIRRLGPGDAAVLDQVAPDVFDEPVASRWRRAFLDDPRHHMVVALDGGVVVGMASAVDYVHPDKAPQLWVNEVGVSPAYQRRGIGRRLVEALVAHARTLGCTYAWVGTEEDNAPARRLYESVGGAAEPFVLYGWDLTAAPAGDGPPAG